MTERIVIINKNLIIKKILDDFAWRGPTGRKMGHIVFTREEAEAILTLLRHPPERST